MTPAEFKALLLDERQPVPPHDEPYVPPLVLVAPEPGVYKHYKGHLYAVSGLTAQHSETSETLILYSRNGHTYARPIALWYAPVVGFPNVPRFTRIQ